MQSDTARHYILATAGHVDHGKTALVRALTGTDTDRLPEERARGITIDLGFARLSLPSPPGAAAAAHYHVGLVDVPGHEDFVRNMVAGVGSVDAALLVVAADDGWMPQTEEHLQILTYLGVRAAVVALSKADLAPDGAAAVAAVRTRLAGTPFEHAPIVPTSCTDGRGVSELRDALANVLAGIPPQPDYGKPRLAVDRAFSLKGVGTVVTGTLVGGTLTRGQSVVAHPRGARARVRTIQSHGTDVAVAHPGSRVALNLPDLRVATNGSHAGTDDVKRGDVIANEDLGRPAAHLFVHLTRSPRPTRDDQRPPPLRHGELLHFHHATAAIPARLRLLGAGHLDPGRHALAHLTLEEPALAFVGDRFVLRDWSGRRTLAGGVVLDPDAPAKPRRGQRKADIWLQDRSRDPLNPATLVATQLRLDRVAPAARLLAKSCLGQAAIASTLEGHARAGRAHVAGDWAVDGDCWATWRAAAVAAVDAHHQAHPEQAGLPLTALRAAVAPHLRGLPPGAAPAVHSALVDDLARDGFECGGTAIHRRGHRPSLPPRLAEIGRQIRRRLAERPFDPPSRKDLCTTDLAHQALRFLIACGEVTDLSPDVALATEAYHAAAARIRAYLATRGQATVSELKGVLSASRRVMVPLLERLDRDGVTRRSGDLRSLR